MSRNLTQADRWDPSEFKRSDVSTDLDKEDTVDNWSLVEETELRQDDDSSEDERSEVSTDLDKKEAIDSLPLVRETKLRQSGYWDPSEFQKPDSSSMTDRSHSKNQKKEERK